MKFMPRAATFAAVTFCAGALANAATLDANMVSQEAPVQAVNAQEHHVVPAPTIVAQLVLKQDGEIVQPLPEGKLKQDQDLETHSAAVAAYEGGAGADSELNCLAVGVYYEAKSEQLAGQLAVADVIINRTKSGRFPKSIC